MSNIIGVVVNSVIDCMKATNTIVSDSVTMDSKKEVYYSTILGGAFIGLFSKPIGIPLMLIATVAGVIDVLYSVEKEDEVVKVTETDMEKYNIFNYIDCKNKKGEFPLLLSKDNNSYRFSRPEGVTVKDILSHKEAICLYLKVKDITVDVVDSNTAFIVKEKKDMIGNHHIYANLEGVNRKGLIAYIGVCLKNGVLVPLSIKFNDRYHLLIASATSGGKSSLIRTILVDLMLNYSDDVVQFYLVDYKRVELHSFSKYKHSIGKCIKNDEDLDVMLSDLECELDRREELLEVADASDIDNYNELNPSTKLNYIVVVIDELASVLKDKKVTERLTRILNIARALGVFFIMATQRPASNIIDGGIKANLVQRIGLQTSSPTDTGVIFDNQSIPLHDITVRGRGFYKYGSDVVEFQGYFVGDPQLKNEKKVIADLLHKYKK